MTSPDRRRRNQANTDSDALEEMRALLGELVPMRQLIEEIRQYPVDLLQRICNLYEARRGPVPDHQLDLVPYLGETSLRALVDGGFITRVDDQQYAIHAYAPTERSLELMRCIEDDSR